MHITNAHPAGSYTVTLTAFSGAGASSVTFNLTVLQGTACGRVSQFNNAADVSVATNPQSVAVGDFNNDGIQDLAIADLGANNVSIRLGDGAGGFTGTTVISLGNNTLPISIAVGDLDNDGNQDLAVANSGSSNNVSILLGNGSGGFTIKQLGIGEPAHAVAIGDFNDDGKQDLAIVKQNSNKVSIRTGKGDGTFNGARDFVVGSTPSSIAIADFNNDGAEDIAVTNQGSSSISILTGEAPAVSTELIFRLPMCQVQSMLVISIMMAMRIWSSPIIRSPARRSF